MVWEKGGSGLVFYTDASHWHNLEGGQYRIMDSKLSNILSVIACVLQILMSSVQKKMTGM